MKRVFDLVRPPFKLPLGVEFIPYTMEMVEPPNTLLFYNNVRRRNNTPAMAGDPPAIVEDPFNVTDYIGLGAPEVPAVPAAAGVPAVPAVPAIPDLRTPQGVHQWIGEVLQPYRNRFETGPGAPIQDMAMETAIDLLYEDTNDLSLRARMSRVPRISHKHISWCETLDKSTGWYDRSLAESA